MLLFLIMLPAARLPAGTTVEDMQREVDDLRRRVNERRNGTEAPIASRVDDMVSGKYGPKAPVTARSGKLEIDGLLQIWDTTYQHARYDVFGRRTNTTGIPGTGDGVDTGGYRIRRAELKFTLDIDENLTSVVMLDPAAEQTSYPGFPSNQGLFKSKAFYAPQFDAATGPGLGDTATIANLQTGAGQAARLLQFAYVNYHGVVPHHDFTVGQFRPKMGEEGVRNDAYLDFAERAMVTQLNNIPDLGVQGHGSWWDDRFQYWFGAFDSAGDDFGTTGQFLNRADDNGDKDGLASAMVRPMWNQGPWGSLELGYSGEWGVHGTAGTGDIVNQTPLNTINRAKTSALRQAAWGMYKPMGPVRGWWLRGEWGEAKDRDLPGSVDALALGTGAGNAQVRPDPMTRQGWYASTGYKLTDSVFADRLSGGGFWNNLMQPVEFVFRYEQFQNIVVESLVSPDTQTDLFKTQVWTAGVNYYIKAYNMRVQVDFMNVDEPEDQPRGLKEIKNNLLIFNTQVSF
ncbi:MAG: porin [Planctomycetota bacterium]